MRRAIPPPTKAQQARLEVINELGCVCCWLDGRSHEPCDIQHMNSCGRNIGWDETFGLCPWHHRGVCRNSATTETMLSMVGPSYAIHRALFRGKYGTDVELLEAQNLIIAATQAARDHPLVLPPR